MSNKTLRVLTIISTIVAVLCMASFSFAVSDPGSFTPASDVSAFDNIGAKIVGGIRSIGVIFSVGILIVLGIKYMMGSAEEKADYKKTMIPYVIGAALIFGATQIASMVYNFASSAGT